jgi:hypothetical protein
MRVKCVTIKDIPQDCFKLLGTDTSYDLVPGKDYVVYGIMLDTSFLRFPLYLLSGEDHYYWPYHYPAPLFNVVDARISRHWVYSFEEDRVGNSFDMNFLFREWVNDPLFFTNLFEGEPEVARIFDHYRELMDLEFPDPSVSNTAMDLGEGWVMCPFCDDSWEADNLNAMVRCPTCKKLSHNPIYKDSTVEGRQR